MNRKRKRKPKRTFERGQRVEARREVGNLWEMATYNGPHPDMRGWHHVTLDVGWDVSPKTGMEISAFSSDAERVGAVTAHSTIVPTSRLRALTGNIVELGDDDARLLFGDETIMPKPEEAPASSVDASRSSKDPAAQGTQGMAPFTDAMHPRGDDLPGENGIPVPDNSPRLPSDFVAGITRPRKCEHESYIDGLEHYIDGLSVAQRPIKVCSDCGKRLGTCANCKVIRALDDNGYIDYHDWPPPCRGICPGAKYSSVETVEHGFATGLAEPVRMPLPREPTSQEIRDEIIAEVGMMANARTPEMRASYDAAVAREINDIQSGPRPRNLVDAPTYRVAGSDPVDMLEAHKIIVRRHVRGDIELVGCSCGFRPMGRKPDDEMAIHFGFVKLRFTTATATVADPK